MPYSVEDKETGKKYFLMQNKKRPHLKYFTSNLKKAKKNGKPLDSVPAGFKVVQNKGTRLFMLKKK